MLPHLKTSHLHLILANIIIFCGLEPQTNAMILFVVTVYVNTLFVPRVPVSYCHVYGCLFVILPVFQTWKTWCLCRCFVVVVVLHYAWGDWFMCFSPSHCSTKLQNAASVCMKPTGSGNSDNYFRSVLCCSLLHDSASEWIVWCLYPQIPSFASSGYAIVYTYIRLTVIRNLGIPKQKSGSLIKSLSLKNAYTF